jgi:hypothetical protein
MCVGKLKVLAIALGLAGTGIVALPQSASAVSVQFAAIADGGAAQGAGQVNLNVTDLGTGAAQFSWTVSAGAQTGMNIAEIYFDDAPAGLGSGNGILTTPITITTETGVNFTAGSANPAELPGGNTLSPAFVTTSGLLADIAQGAGGSANGLTIGDVLVFKISYAAGKSFANLLTALNDGSLRVGFHARSLTADAGITSEGFYSVGTTAVPIPATGFLLLGGLGGLAALRRRRKKAA